MNNTMSRLTGVGLGAMLLIVGSTATTAVAHPWPRTANFDLTASAQPTAAESYVGDDAFDASTSLRQRVRADTTATSSATCDGCSGDASTLQVLYLKRPRSTHVDNVAVAWTTCTSCGAFALSVQVVVIDGAASPVTANNRALAVNAGCEACGTASAAFQLVVVAPDAERLSGAAMDDLRAWVSAQREILHASVEPTSVPPTSTPDVPAPTDGPAELGRRSALPDENAVDAETDLAALAALVNVDLGSRTDEAHAEVALPAGDGS